MSRLADGVLQRLREGIVAGDYPPGSRLTEAGLCRDFSVSRVPVREALKKLEAEGFVTSRAYAGMTVARMSTDDAADLFAVRRTIEAATVRRSAVRFRDEPQDEEVLAFGGQLAELVAVAGSALDAAHREDLPALNTRFHLSIAEFSGSQSMLTLLRQVAAKIEWLYALDVAVRGEHSWAEHAEIAEQVSRGRVREAVRLMGRHIDNSMEGFLLRHADADPPAGQR